MQKKIDRIKTIIKYHIILFFNFFNSFSTAAKYSFLSCLSSIILFNCFLLLDNIFNKFDITKVNISTSAKKKKNLKHHRYDKYQIYIHQYKIKHLKRNLFHNQKLKNLI